MRKTILATGAAIFLTAATLAAEENSLSSQISRAPLKSPGISSRDLFDQPEQTAVNEHAAKCPALPKQPANPIYPHQEKEQLGDLLPPELKNRRYDQPLKNTYRNPNELRLELTPDGLKKQ